ncbi:MAG: TIGR03067 domain-containing protein [Gemmataceae bacterium]
MKTITTIGILLVSLLAAADDDGKKDLKAMQGDWVGEKMVRDGMPFPDDSAQALFRTMKGNAYTVHRFRTKAGAGTLKLDATKDPRQIDMTPDGGKAGTILGIYKIDGDTLTICYAPPKGKRPEAFESKEGTGVTLSVWVREKK